MEDVGGLSFLRPFHGPMFRQVGGRHSGPGTYRAPCRMIAREPRSGASTLQSMTHDVHIRGEDQGVRRGPDVDRGSSR